jgi:hypothetical protein
MYLSATAALSTKLDERVSAAGRRYRGSASLLLEQTSNKVTWSNTTCPDDGTNSSASTPETCVGHLTPPF